MSDTLKNRINARLDRLFKNRSWSMVVLRDASLGVFSKRCKNQLVLSLRWFNLRNAFEFSWGINDQFDQTLWLIISVPFVVRWYVYFNGKPPAWIGNYAGQYQTTRSGVVLNLTWLHVSWRHNEMDYQYDRGWSKSLFWKDLLYGACRYTYIDGDKVAIQAYIPLIDKFDAKSFTAIVTPRTELRQYCNRMIPSRKRLTYIVNVIDPPTVKCFSGSTSSGVDDCISEYACCADNPEQAVGKYCYMVTEMRRAKRRGT